MLSVGFDVDETFADSWGATLREIHKLYNIKVDKEELEFWHIHQNEPFKELGQQKVMEVFARLWRENYRSIGLIDPRIPEIMRGIGPFVHREIVTSNPIDPDIMKDWLKFSDIKFDRFTHLPDNSAGKAKVDVEVMVDDYHKVAQVCIESGKTVVLLRKRWNLEFAVRNAKNPMLKMADDWPSIKRHLLDEHQARSLMRSSAPSKVRSV